MEGGKTNDVLEKKLDGYGIDMRNFKAIDEIMVEITLNEYRDLVANDATRKQAIDKAEESKYQREKEIENLKKSNEELKAENYELKKKVEEIENILLSEEKKKDELKERLRYANAQAESWKKECQETAERRMTQSSPEEQEEEEE